LLSLVGGNQIGLALALIAVELLLGVHEAVLSSVQSSLELTACFLSIHRIQLRDHLTLLDGIA